MNATAIILAGGKSSRMGTNKALLPMDGKPNIELIKDQLTPFFSDIIVVTNDFEAYEFLKVPMVKDEYVGKGPLAGIHTGLKNSNTETNFFVACDMPFVSGELAQYLVSLCENYDAVVPNINGTLHPLFSVFKKETLPKIEQCLQAERLRIRDFLNEVAVLFVHENDIDPVLVGNIEKVFYNMNYPVDYEKARNWLKQ
ncbi:molybdenum cofactor guanylyltransferase [Schinkia azotoformans]|uniref:Probable molybdenum cofactor guanylyltransferase n=1 Tax=Schinkia azotoformans LMG 9581 TaxID=1131731 RepID=K6E518_SCHAZ|nr:molybdenum cofactor guanylyltransferase [Schinkia azotoformans]EKN68356.1 molybdopterin-guanine dinucleotide biosynthesis protein A [Schinkia azotoformans LMG 9581]MEC1638532.1 molybdenum cofactor guanylyltransferase [Schinkia azotoformans]MEC1721389.1 molybdenum cofactor guanylyltransferase [Schinkia azotoformans]MEC1946034.1 molybdenum cofactor guanylyltransferase [Schinkia azotoformans]MED4351536.1 molybdenum cofactor guanylyltransferase [Schinkia azotoformans]